MLEQERLHQPQIHSFEERQTHEQCAIKYSTGAFEGMVQARSSVQPENPPQGLHGGTLVMPPSLHPGLTHPLGSQLPAL